jgi:subtilase family serine protease
VFEVTATITADSTNTVDESDETNNTGTRMFGPG